MITAAVTLLTLTGCNEDQATYVEARLRADRKGDPVAVVHETMTMTNAIYRFGSRVRQQDSYTPIQNSPSEALSFTGQSNFQLPERHHTPVKLDLILRNYDLMSLTSDDMDVYAIQKSTGRKLDIGFADRFLLFSQPIQQEGPDAIVKLDIWSMESSSSVVRAGEIFILKVDFFRPGTKEVVTRLSFEVSVIR